MTKGKEIDDGSDKILADSPLGQEFNPRPTTFKDDREMMQYVEKWGASIGDKVKITLAAKRVNFKVAPKEIGFVYFPIMAIAQGAYLPLSTFARNVLNFFRLAPTQLKTGSWRVVIGFEKLCRLYGFSFGLDEFRSLYRLNASTKDNSCYFVPAVKGRKLIEKLPDNDDGWERMIALVSGMWESDDPLD